jgi:hypothetical protein
MSKHVWGLFTGHFATCFFDDQNDFATPLADDIMHLEPWDRFWGTGQMCLVGESSY